MFCLRRRPVLSLFLALSLVLAPLFSAAHMGMAGASSSSPVDQHAVNGGEHAHHALDPSAGDDHGQARCTTHDACAGQCCVGCAHCVTAMVAIPLLSFPLHPVQTPVVLTLHLSHLPAVHNRPPQA